MRILVCYLRQLVYSSLTREQDGSRQHALKKLGACALVYPADALFSNDCT
jgi:hypothetical protein